jgi:hypothetical protein
MTAMINRCSNRVGLRAAALAGLLVAAAARAPAQPGAAASEIPFDGEWSLSFDVATSPGGVTLTNQYGTDSPYHMTFHASKQSLQVKADGTIAWRDFENGALRIDGTANYVGTRTKHWASHRPLLKAAGKATATPTPSGSPQPYDRSLEVNLEYTGGSGTYGDNHGGGGAYLVDAAGEQMTVTGGVTTSTIPVIYWKAKWSLKPTRIVRQEISPNEICETTSYAGTRQAEIATQTSGKYKVTERIEIKHVRNLNLVPRG